MVCERRPFVFSQEEENMGESLWGGFQSYFCGRVTRILSLEVVVTKHCASAKGTVS